MSALDHDGARRIMAAGVEGRLETAEERDLALHLVGCPECKRLYEGLQQAHPALAAIGVGTPPSSAVDAAVRRATTVLRGDADPGPLSPAGAVPTGERPRTDWEKETGPLLAEDAVEPREEPKAQPTEQPLVEASIAESPPPPVTKPTEPQRPEPPGEPAPPPKPTPPPQERVLTTLPFVTEEEPAAPKPPPPEPPPPSRPPSPPSPEPPTPTRPPSPPVREIELPILPPRAADTPVRPTEPPVHATVPLSPAPTRVSSSTVGPPVSYPDEVEALLDEDYAREPMGLPGRPTREDRDVGPGPWLAAIAVTIALAVLAAVLITRGGGIFGGKGDLPSAEEASSRMQRVFTDMKSLKTSFSIRRLSLYRVGGQPASLAYSFANGLYTGRIVYDRAEGYRQEVSLDVSDREVDKAKIVQTDAETKSIVGSSNELFDEKRPPLGPPDGQLRLKLGVLEQSVGAAVNMMLDADDVQVVGRTEQDGHELYQLIADVEANELTRADRIEIFLDARNFFPTIVRRTLARADAGVLGPPDVLTDDAISTAYGDRGRITTELVQLDNVVLDDIVLPGELVLDAPAGAQTKASDSGYERVARNQAAEKLPFKPLYPRTLPEGFKEQAVAVYTGEKHPWGPGGRYPAPDGVLHASYFDGLRTIVVTERNIPTGPFTLDASPLQGSGLPVTVRSFDRAAKRFFYGVSPETPPHAYGFLGNVFVMVVGYAPATDLIDVLASLGEAPGQAVAPSPGATSSPAASTGAGTLPGEGNP
jgi:hypothetical protein